ncbi:hypothetical protein [Enterobacter hormaechei]|uniref:hypothetical protein n=1 Tax=Enterobacter hormaechei TaxID=158836 RepID=UPI002B251E43|nr:hypothetical protein [Enterobacter hormaechei]
MKCLIIAAVVLASFGANAGVHNSEIDYTCGNHKLVEYGMKADGENHWHVSLVASTDGVMVYSGDENDVPFKRVSKELGFYYLNGFIWAVGDNPETTSYSNDNGASFHRCINTNG